MRVSGEHPRCLNLPRTLQGETKSLMQIINPMNLPPRLIIVLGLALLPLIGWMDYLTGHDFSFSVFYLPAIALVTWYGGKTFGFVAAGLGALIWFSADLLTGAALSFEIHVWNAFVRLCIFLLTALFVRSVHFQTISHQENTASRLRKTDGFQRVLPICPHCKRIRDERMTWHQVDVFIKQQTDIDLASTTCPDCAEQTTTPPVT